jgi:hypothetical protein
MAISSSTDPSSNEYLSETIPSLKNGLFHVFISIPKLISLEPTNPKNKEITRRTIIPYKNTIY